MESESEYMPALKAVIKAMAPGQSPVVEERILGRIACLTIRPDARSFGALIGSKGATYQALKVIYGRLVMESFQFPDFEVSVTPPDSKERFRNEFRLNPSFTAGEIEKLVESISNHLFTDGFGLTVSEMSPELVAVQIESDGTEQEDRIMEIEDALAKVFHAVGMTKGRKIKLAIS